MITILLNKRNKETLFKHLLQSSEQENMAVAFCGISKTKNNFTFLVKKVLYLQSEHLVTHSKTGLEISENVYRKFLLTAKKLNLSLVFIHSHPFTDKAWFSSIDDKNDLVHAKFIKENINQIYYANMVVAQKEFKARLFDKKKNEFVEINELKILGEFSTQENNTNVTIVDYDRNYRAFTKSGQDIISNVKVALIGAGGLGWQIAMQLTSLGVKNLLLIDPDKIEKTNLNRLPALPHSKVGKSKVQVLSSILKRMNPNIKVNYRAKSVLDTRIMNELKEYDIIIGAVDSENIRLELNKFAVKYLKYYIDAGSEIILENEKVKHAGGQISTVIPGFTPCLCCNPILDYKMISYENLSPEEKEAEVKGGYIRDVNEPSPSIVSINGVVASSLVNEFISLTTKFKSPTPYLFFDFMNKEKLLYPIKVKKNPNCLICSKDAFYGYGDSEKQIISNSLPTFLEMEEI